MKGNANLSKFKLECISISQAYRAYLDIGTVHLGILTKLKTNKTSEPYPHIKTNFIQSVKQKILCITFFGGGGTYIP